MGAYVFLIVLVARKISERSRSMSRISRDQALRGSDSSNFLDNDLNWDNDTSLRIIMLALRIGNPDLRPELAHAPAIRQ